MKDQVNTKPLQAFIKALKNPPYARVGILGDKSAREDGPNTNATIGAKHEFGQDGMPIRSFLRVPLIDHMQDYLERSGAFTPKVAKKILKDGSIHEWIEKLGIVAEGVIFDGFASGGFGKWPASDMSKKKVQMTLIESGQLQGSITSEVSDS